MSDLPAIAQILPDNSLGSESSRTRSETIKGIESDVIEGGATRRSNLFHSFKEFSIKEGRGAYFANPEAIQNIFTRVTGGNVSNILGTLGVLGNANLFLINPSGIIFGPNARLDIRGAFIGSTADSLVFDNNFEFSATNPDAPPLLTVNIPIGLRFREKAADISSTGNLTTPGNLTLKAGNLNLSGNLAAGGNLTLEALDTLIIRDTQLNPFLAIAGGNLLLQGNQSVDIYALNHPQSGLISGSNMVLRSANAVSGDAHFWSGGSFRIERLDGSLGGLVSLYDPVIRASGDVELQSYTGTSLHILAGGYVYIPGTIEITGVDDTGDTLAETVILSDGSTINIDGSLEPTLDIRSGTTAVSNPFFDTGTPTSADLFIGNITFAPSFGNGGKVFLTNQYKPNTALQTLFGGVNVGAITTSDVFGGGSVTIDSRSGINLSGIINASSFNFSPSLDVPPTYFGNGGNVTLLSQGNILTNSIILAQGLLGGNVTLTSTGDVFLDNVFINVQGGGRGNITIDAQNVNLLNASILSAGIAAGLGSPEAQAGDITINATNTVAIASVIANTVLLKSVGNAGKVIINTKILEGTGQFLIGSATSGNGNAGQVIVNATEQISLTGVFGSVISSAVDKTAIGNGGDIIINTPKLSLSNAALVTSTIGQGNAGNIKIHATESISISQESQLQAFSASQGNAGKITIDAEEATVSLDGFLTAISTSILADQEGHTGTGLGDHINITAKSLDLTNGAKIITSTDGKAGANGLANAGNIYINVANAVSLSGRSQLKSDTSGEGNAGGIEIATSSLSLKGGAQINASTSSNEDAGMIKITASETISLSGVDSNGAASYIRSRVEPQAEGNAGGIEITTGSLSLKDGAQVDASTFGKGNAGPVKITASNTITAIGEDSQGHVSAIFSQVADGAEGNAGGIDITTGSLSLTNGATVNASTLGRGDAGAVKIIANDTIAAVGENSSHLISSIFSRVESTGKGKSGGIEIKTGSLSLKNGAAINASTLGRGDAGAIKITASDTIAAVGENSQSDISGIFSRVGEPSNQSAIAEGNAGGINIKTGSLSLNDGAVIDASTFGRGNAGAVGITANNAISIAGKNSQGHISGIFSTVKNTAEGNAGGIDISTGSFSLSDGADVNASTEGKGKAENIIITANTLESTGESKIRTDTQTNFDAADITLNISDTLTLSNSSLIAQTTGEGKAGDITVNAPQLNITEGAIISAQTSALGNGGIITVNAPISVALGENSQLNVETSGEGKAGNIEIISDTVTIGKNARISATAKETATNTEGGGSININASNLNIAGELGIFAETQGQSPAGTLTLKPDKNQPNLNIQFTDNGFISASTKASGNGGSIAITAPETINIQGNGNIFTQTSGSGKAGNITITTNQLNITDGVKISASTSNLGNSGNITLNALNLNLDQATIQALTTNQGNPGSIFISHQGQNSQNVSLRNSTISTEINAEGNRETAQPTNITINTDSLFLDNSKITASTAANRNAGNINLNVSQTVSLDNGSKLEVETENIGDAGDIKINTPRLNIGANAELSARTRQQAQGKAGNITLNVNQLNISGRLGIFAETEGSADAGDLMINPFANNSNLTINFTNQGNISASTLGSGKGGGINITAPETINIGGNGVIVVKTEGKGNAGIINIGSQNLNLTDGLEISASTTGSGSAGNINLSPNSLNLNQTQITATTSGQGNAGSIIVPNANQITLDHSTISTVIAPTGIATQPSNIILNTQQLNLNNDSHITSSTQGKGTAGSITVPNAQNITLNQSEITASTSGQGNTGVINLNASDTLQLTNNSEISSAVEKDAVGNSQQITLNTPHLNLNNSTVSAATNGTGDAGSIIIPNAQTISLDNSTISTEIQEHGVATEASNIALTSNTLNLNNSNITASTAGTGNAGEITLSNQQLNLNNSNISARSTGIGNAGSISLPDTQTLSLNQSEISVSTSKKGDASSINVPTAYNINLNQSQITASTLGEGNTGIINLTGTQKITLTASQISSAVEQGAFGNSQQIILNTPNLTLLNNSSISAATAGIGNAGSIIIPNAQIISLDHSTISSAIAPTGQSTQPSNINIQTQQLTLNNNSQITATTSGFGDAGKITITADSLTSNNRSSIQTNTSSSGKAGDLVFQIQDNLTLSNSNVEASTNPNSTGDGGSISIDPKTVTLTDGARISVNNQGLGNGGNISLFAQNLTLNNRSEISAATASGEGGNITLNVPDTIRQQNNSPISATAGGTGNGGNVTIKTKFLIGNGNSDITANAYSGAGGNINITADGIFRASNSAITASSQLGVDGVVDTNTPEVDPSRGLINLPQNIVDPNALISQNACRKGNTSEFIVRGRGGLPSTPEQVQSSNEVEVNLVEATEQTAIIKPKPETISTRKIVPAQGWQRNDKGEMVLVAYPTTDRANRQVTTSTNCSSYQ